MAFGENGLSRFSYATGENAAYIDQVYSRFKLDPSSVDEGWRKFFEGVEFAASTGVSVASGGGSHDSALVEAWINAFRRLGHLSAHLNPLDPKPGLRADMQAQAHGLSHVADGDTFVPANLPGGKGPMTFAAIRDLMIQTYCGRIGAEFREIDDIDVVVWFQEKMESCRNQPAFPPEVRKRILSKLIEAEGFERFLHARYLGQKRFSLEGLDAFVPLVDTIISEAGKATVDEIVIGMAHRGRLNTLVNIMGKPLEFMFKEFEGGEFRAFDIDGDVKYHMGFASEVQTFGAGRMRLYLSPNPSHLEIVNPVVEGFTRARQRMMAGNDRGRVVPILVHGDAAFMGQGVVMETLNLSRLPAYETGGTIHIITNNQVGFTTNPEEARSCTYASGVAKIVRAPVLHVNADDPEAVAWCGMLAVEYRQRFKQDIVIDLIGYRRHGHNETDEPAFTQPLMYRKVNSHPTVLTQYSSHLVQAGVLSQGEYDGLNEAWKNKLQTAFENVRAGKMPGDSTIAPPKALEKSAVHVRVDEKEFWKPVDTGIKSSRIRDLVAKMTTLPPGFTPNPKIARLLETRRKMVEGAGAIDWALGELLAFASLAVDGHHVRLSGQDCQRGTFSSRHGVVRDVETGAAFNLLGQLASGQGDVEIINSPLSEAGVMGFEFGFTVADPDALVLWEAQFGDFCNGAQIIIDQFLCASEAKWKQTSGLVLLLPHGYEGMGPEHSSARPERFLQLCGNTNMQMVNLTTPAQHFHALRRQLVRKFRKPLIMMTPKSLLRHPAVISSLDQFESGSFQEVIDESVLKQTDARKSSRVVLSSGKIYYELLEMRGKLSGSAAGVPLVRLEQLHPFPEAMLGKILSAYKQANEFVWVQEEPQNMGGWNFVRPLLNDLIEEISDGAAKLIYVGRRSSGTTAEGSSKAHAVEQERILSTALGVSSVGSGAGKKK
jgi:2-oxoglutarate dehydrogenase E1 component